MDQAFYGTAADNSADDDCDIDLRLSEIDVDQASEQAITRIDCTGTTSGTHCC